MNQLSVVIITLNEEDNIARCIDSVQAVADEIIVVDSFSTDRTQQIAVGKGAKFIQRKFTGYIEQKNFATAQASNDFVLNMDADECLSPELRKSILAAKQNGFTAYAYSMNRLNFYCGKAIKTCGWYPDTKVRLWNRNKGRWIGALVHEKMSLDKDVTVVHLTGDLLHYSYPTPQALSSQVENFAGLAAQQLKDKSIFTLLYKLTFSPVFKFIRNYFFKLGIKDGATGLTICYQQAREVFLKYAGAMRLKYS